METNKLTRQEIYDQIKANSKDAYILSEMKKLGFWDKNQPEVTTEIIEEEAALMQELRKLEKEYAKYNDPEKALNEIKKARMKASRQRQALLKEERIAHQNAKAKAYQDRIANDITYIGDFD